VRTVREVVSRALRELERDDLVPCRKHDVLVRDRERSMSAVDDARIELLVALTRLAVRAS